MPMKVNKIERGVSRGASTHTVTSPDGTVRVKRLDAETITLLRNRGYTVVPGRPEPEPEPAPEPTPEPAGSGSGEDDKPEPKPPAKKPAAKQKAQRGPANDKARLPERDKSGTPEPQGTGTPKPQEA